MPSLKTEEIIFPTDKIQAKLSVHGIYSIPEEWKTTDQTNPGLFTYIVRMSKFEITKGKICPRQLTDRQKREQQEKNKKGGKKDSKNPQPNQEEQKQKKIQQQKQKQRQQLFSKLNAQQQFYHTAEDIFRSPYLKFEQNQSENIFKGNESLIFQERLLKDKGDWIYIYKVPVVSEDELAKMRKTKPKTLNNINDLNPVIMRAWINFEELSSSNKKTSIKQARCKVVQVDRTAQTSEPNLQKTYIKVTISLQQSIVREKDPLSVSSLINDPQKPRQISPQTKCLNQLRQQLALAIQSLAIQYSTMFWKQINMQQEQRNSQVFLNNKKGELSKRKEQFLYDFNITGKYKILKDRIKKCIVHVCQTKYKQFFAGMKTFNGVKCNSLDQIYSEIYNLLVSSYQQTLFKIIQQKEQGLGEVLIQNNQTLKNIKQNILSSYKQQTVVERVKRTIRQYEIIQDFSHGQRNLRKYMEQYPQVTQLKYQYGIYCLKYSLKPSKELLPLIQQFLTKQKHTLTEQKKIQYMFILFNTGITQNYLKGWIILRELIENQFKQNKSSQGEKLCRWLLLASVVLKSIEKQQLSYKYRCFALKQYMKLNAKQNVSTVHKENPSKTQIPSVSSVATYQQTGSEDDLNKLYDNLIRFLNDFSAFQLVRKIFAVKALSQNQPKQNSDQINLQKLMPQIRQLLKNQTTQSNQRLIEICEQIYEKSSLMQTSQRNTVLDIIQKVYFSKTLKSQQKSIQDLKYLENILKKILTGNTDQFSRFITLIRLGYVYCEKQQYGNARACLLKYLQKGSRYPEYLSGLSYKLLGIACLKLNRAEDAIQNFKHWNLCDPKSKCSWLYIALTYCELDNFVIVNQCLTQYKKRALQDQQSIQEKQILTQISLGMINKQNNGGQYEQVLKQKIITILA